MGWTLTQRVPGAQTQREFFQREFGSSLEIIEAKSNLGVTYMAARPAAHPEMVVALVVLTRWRPKDQYNFGYKEMDESMHPYYFDCPAEILDLLTDPINESALEWRKRCRENLAKQQAQVPKGTVVRFGAPLLFTDGSVADTFELIERTTFWRLVPLDFKPEIGSPWYRQAKVKISNWRQREYEVINA